MIWCCQCKAPVNRVEYFYDRALRGTWTKVYCHGAEQEELIEDRFRQQGMITRIECFQEKSIGGPSQR